MKLWQKVLLIGLALLVVYLVVFCVWPWVSFTRAEQEALAIIGGADGPTSILIGTIVP